jgi:hypothetical protein
MTIEQLVAAIRSLPLPARLRVIELAAHDVAHDVADRTADTDPGTGVPLLEHHGAAEPAGATAPSSATPQSTRQLAPAVLLVRLSGPLTSLIACGTAALDEPGFITLVLREDEAAQGGMASVSLHVDLRCPDCAGQERSAGCARCGGRRTVDELFSAWLAVPPGVTAGEVLAPSVELPGMVEPVRFRVRLAGTR